MRLLLIGAQKQKRTILAIAKSLGVARFMRIIAPAMPEKRTHQLNLHITEERFREMEERMVLGGHRNPSAYLAALMDLEKQHLAKGPCEECKVARALETLLAVGLPKRKRARKKR